MIFAVINIAIYGHDLVNKLFITKISKKTLIFVKRTQINLCR